MCSCQHALPLAHNTPTASWDDALTHNKLPIQKCSCRVPTTCHSDDDATARHSPRRTHAVATQLHPQSPTTAGACRVWSAASSAAPTSRPHRQTGCCSGCCCCCRYRQIRQQLLLQMLLLPAGACCSQQAAACCCMEGTGAARGAETAGKLRGCCCNGRLAVLCCLILAY
jgi:hypothetical protein